MGNPLLVLMTRHLARRPRPGSRRRAVSIPTEGPSTDAIFLVLRRIRAPLIVLILVFALSVLGLSLIPGEDAAALPWLAYECTVTLDAEQARGPLVLDLGPGTVLPADGAGSGYRALLAPPVREIAAVSVDGEGAGLLWRAPFRLDLTGRLREGTSTLRLEVRGTTAPAVADPVTAQAAAQEIVSAHEAYGERFQQQELPRMLDGVALGLGAVPVLRRG